jgi:hypothetical protein
VSERMFHEPGNVRLSMLRSARLALPAGRGRRYVGGPCALARNHHLFSRSRVGESMLIMETRVVKRKYQP